MNWLSRLKLAWAIARTPLYVPEADLDGAWTEEDGLALDAFFRSAHGQKLKMRLTNYVLRSAVQATVAKDNLPYNCGIARGVALAVAVIENHFSQVPATRDKTSETEQAAPSFADEFAA